jgi:hypothetical protein
MLCRLWGGARIRQRRIALAAGPALRRAEAGLSQQDLSAPKASPLIWRTSVPRAETHC